MNPYDAVSCCERNDVHVHGPFFAALPWMLFVGHSVIGAFGQRAVAERAAALLEAHGLVSVPETAAGAEGSG